MVPPSREADTLRKIIEEEIATHNRAVLELKTRLNTLVPISVLPPEILVEIFIRYARAPKALFLRCNACATYAWVRVTQVCSHWRAVALDCPELWSRIVVIPRLQWTREMLARSKQAPLQVVADFSRYGMEKEQALELVLKEYSRIQDLCVTAPRSTLGDSWNPESVLWLNGQMPNLRRLVIHHDTFHWDSIHFCHKLRHLEIISHQNDNLRMSDMLDALENLSLLESLILEDVIPSLPSDTTVIPVVSRPITLPNLLSIELLAATIDCANVLNHLDLPKLVSIVLNCSFRRGVQDLAPCLAAKVSTILPLHMLSVHQATCGGVRVRGYDVQQSFGPESEAIPSKFDFRISYCDYQDVLKTVCRCLPLSEVRRLDVSGISFMSDSGWLEAFGHMKRLSTLQACNVSVDLPRALHIREMDEGTNITYFLPQLRVLKLNQVRLQERFDYENGDLGGFIGALADCLSERYEYGAEIRKLVLTKCANVDEIDIGLLREIAVTVSWDGIINIDESEDEGELGEYYGLYRDDSDDLSGGSD
ncbi:hypothetical protein AcW1_006628 [Taiwanofungus camphoratus]|nr:hypothetical protein AcV5_009216 [Antrodia cinnamomea]KAI0924519.1 hypothetical protein AcW2_005389 [Antrodia cinnamomea]KAI0954119.1 hypothetical protein AcV7_007441 [Antrodia cinnamomea]KAI0954861.1 hypothetical protein AcW1_006628 [Antrodia cinnamomea]